MITDTDVLFLACILLAMVCAGLCWYAWQEHVQCSVNRIRAEENATWADHFQAALDDCAAENARLRRLVTQRQRQPVSNQQSTITHQQSIRSLPIHSVTLTQFHTN